MSTAKRVNFDEEDESSEEEPDFSASEDEWIPPGEELPSDATDDDEDFESETTVRAVKRKSSSKNLSSSRQRSSLNNSSKTISSLRHRMFNKYKPTTKVVSSPKSLDKRLSKILNSSQYRKKKSIANSNQDSDSSGDDYLVNPKEIDLKSSFFDVVKKPSSSDTEDKDVPNFDCNAGIQLSDSENDDDEMDEVKSSNSSPKHINENEKSSNSNMIKGINRNSSGQIDFHKLINYNKAAEEAEDRMRKLKSTTFGNDDVDVDVTKLLALGEGTSSNKVASSHSEQHAKKQPPDGSKKRKKIAAAAGSDSDSDWEHVQDHAPALETNVKDILQINIPLPEQIARKKKEGADVAMMLKRRLNRDTKEHQVYLHKITLLCHIAHGIHCNRILNSPQLMTAALKLLPNKTCYPDGSTCIKYFESISKWYKQAMPIRKNQMYLGTMKRPPISVSLALQIKYKEALCKKDFVLIFIILLRAMGIPCRLVINLTPLPFKPPQSELHSLTMKPDKKVVKTEKKEKKIKLKEEKISKSEEKEEDRQKITNKRSLRNKTCATLEKSKENLAKAKVEIEKNVKPKTQTVVKTDKTENAPAPKRVKKNENPPKKETKSETKEHVKNKKETNVELKPIIKESQAISEASKSSLSEKTKEIHASKKTTNLSKINSKEKETEQISDSVENTHFKEIKKNTAAKRIKLTSAATQKEPTPSSSKPKKDSTKSIYFQLPTTQEVIPSTSKQKKDLTKSIYFQLPTTRTTRSATKNAGLVPEDLKIPQLDGADDAQIDFKKSKSKSKPRKPSINSDDDFVPSPPKKIRPNKQTASTSTASRKPKDKRVLSTDSDSETKVNKKKMDIWVEVYSEKEAKWVAINLFNSEVDKIDNIRKSATSPVAYVFAWDNDNFLKDVSPRYCPQWNTATRKVRVDKDWLDVAIINYLGPRTRRSKAEDVEFHRMHLDKPLPTSISEYKNHPLYALQRHLLKFEAIYPPDAVTLGFVRGEPIYARECVKTLHSREIWLKSARVVRPREEPYKIVKARPKWDRHNQTVIKDLPLEIFGYWQTMEYDPPTAENGIVPRNAYGNVDLFKPTMLPKKTVHLHLPGLNRVCKKLKIDCAPAVIGFDFHQGACHPMIDGYIVCEEFAEIVTDAWTRDQEEAERRQDEKYYQRVYGNWKKLIRGLLIGERLKVKYNFKSLKPVEKPKKKRRGR